MKDRTAIVAIVAIATIAFGAFGFAAWLFDRQTRRAFGPPFRPVAPEDEYAYANAMSPDPYQRALLRRPDEPLSTIRRASLAALEEFDEPDLERPSGRRKGRR